MDFDQRGFEEHYAKGSTPWDTDEVDPVLIHVLDGGQLPGKTVLEIGCGTGTNAIEFARRAYDVVAVDFVQQAVDAAKRKANAAKARVAFKRADVLKDDLGGPYDVLFDRGVYHGLRLANLRRFQEVLEKVTRRGTRWFTLAGNAKEESKGMGPPRVHEHEFRAELGGLFDFISIREFRFGTDKDEFRPLGWAVLMQRK
jgi:SAM-dependent methyltransferase